MKILKNGKELREKLWANASRLYNSLNDMGYTLGPEISTVVAVMLDTREQALTFWRGLLENGIYVNLVFPPATPGDKSLVRCSVSAAHSDEQIDKICEAFRSLRDVAG